MLNEKVKNDFINFLKKINEDKELAKKFSKKKNINESYEFVKKYVKGIELEDYKKIILNFSKKIDKPVLTNDDLKKISSGGTSNYVDMKLIQDIANTIGQTADSSFTIFDQVRKILKKMF